MAAGLYRITGSQAARIKRLLDAHDGGQLTRTDTPRRDAPGAPTETYLAITTSAITPYGPITTTVGSLAAAIASGDLSATVASAGRLPPVPFLAVIDSESINVTAITGTTLTIQRAREGTTAAAHANGALLTITENGIGSGDVILSAAIQNQLGVYRLNEDAYVTETAYNDSLTAIPPSAHVMLLRDPFSGLLFVVPGSATPHTPAGAGAPTLGAMTCAGVGSFFIHPGGALVLGRMTVAGAGTWSAGTRTGSGAPSFGAMVCAGSGNSYNVNPSGRLYTQAMRCAGVGTVRPPPVGSGVLAMAAMTLAGQGTLINPYSPSPATFPTVPTFTAKITAVALVGGFWVYDWIQQEIDPATGSYRNATPSAYSGTTGTGPYMRELNGNRVAVPSFVFARLRGMWNGQPLYDFDRCCTVNVVSGNGTGSGNLVLRGMTCAGAGTTGNGGNQQTFTTAGTNNFTVPGGVTTVHIQTWGGGGDDLDGSGGGGGGGYAECDMSVVAGQVLACVIANTNVGFGSGSTVTNNSNNDAIGAENGGVASGGFAGAGGPGAWTFSNGAGTLTNHVTHDGGNGVAGNPGGGGGCAGSTGNGGNAAAGIGGAAGSGGTAGAGGNDSANGNAVGGGGGRNGTGSLGKIRITW